MLNLIPLYPYTRGGGSEPVAYAIVDTDDFNKFGKLRWYYKRMKGNAGGYAIRFVYQNGRRREVLLHRAVFYQDPLGAPGKDQGLVVDHINGIGIDCRRDNLRLATRSENAKNIPKQEQDDSPEVEGSGGALTDW